MTRIHFFLGFDRDEQKDFGIHEDFLGIKPTIWEMGDAQSPLVTAALHQRKMDND